MSSIKRIIAESIIENFGSISPYVVKQSLEDMVAENAGLMRAIENIYDAHESKTPDEFHEWFGKQVTFAKASLAHDAAKAASLPAHTAQGQGEEALIDRMAHINDGCECRICKSQPAQGGA